ncbi:MFS transporter [Ktedonosporobacter rubrisoli]|uniref:MFS transporter n=1 Tax=Ktedonosporobacter rubrisoli TaxID=2509675 RepID=A0A4P6JP54_KTERU|nr:MFS transporter [Ktedonosporobacter rubrisoli]QBD76910.1 MFS transporter [Ktedonosporobacter rubrisoli]
MKQWKTQLGLPQTTQGTNGFLLVLIIDALGSGLFLPISILYFQVTAGLPLPIIGLALTIATICTLPITLLTGSLVDSFGARRLTACSQIIQTIGLFGYLFMHTIPGMFLMALLITGGNRMFYAASTVLVVEIASPDERDRWYGLIRAIRSAGNTLGGILAGFVVATNNPAIYRLLIGSSAACYLIAASLLLRLPEPNYRHDAQASPAPYLAILKDGPFLGFLISNLPFLLCNLILGIALPVYITEAVQAPSWLLPALSFNTLLGIGLQTLVVRFQEPYRRTRIIGAAALTWCISCSLFALALFIPRALLVPYCFFVVALHTFASLMYNPTAGSLVAELSPLASRGRYLAAIEFSWGIASAITPALFTALYAFAPALPWLVLSVLVAISGMAILQLERRFPARAVRSGKQA